MSHVIDEIISERGAQDAKWGEQNHPNGTGPEQRFIDGRTYADLADHAKGTTDVNARYETLTYKDIFLEEVFEAMAEEDPENLRTELIQCAAVAVAWVEKIDRDAQQDPIAQEDGPVNGCTCGCGKDRSTVIREIMTTECLNEEQAEARLDSANRARRELASGVEADQSAPFTGPGYDAHPGHDHEDCCK